MTPLQQAAKEMLDAINAQGWHKAEMLRKALADEMAQAVEPVAYLIDWPDEPELGHYFSESATESGRSTPLYAHPAPPPAGDQIDWQDMYLKQKSEKEAMAAKYEKDIGPLASMAPVSCGYDETTGNCTSNQCCYTPAVTGERAELIAWLHRHYGIGNWYSEMMRKAAYMLEADVSLINEGNKAQQVAVPAPVARVDSWTNGSYSRNYKITWLENVPEGTLLYASAQGAKQ